ncbi:preprotein translocase subunit SecE [Pseudomethylobacillus aquaticus]|uniref:Protein translocase subunit SecE n=1 Tax=Pseudomethylobacillus aquaticus TaxID=2676064 RepID=A0A3N0V3R8_9PROT|nr:MULTISPECIES: preprotein translocase subunit SecE [Methylophilaceae]ROH87118.1 preprotein translocase subunit SecE [Pseudomethylobacillus aquaticus]
MTEKIKLVLALLLLAAGLAGFYVLAEQALVLRILAVMAGIAAALAVLWTTVLGQQAFAFSRESVAETRKVVWPSRKETTQTTLIVFVLVLVMAIFLWIVDVGFLWAVQKLMGRG